MDQNNELKILEETTKLDLMPIINQDALDLSHSTKLPLSTLGTLGISANSIITAISTICSPENGSGIYKVTVPKGTHLASFKNGAGNLGSVLGYNNKVSGQAVLNPVAFDPTMICVAAVLHNIECKLDSIEESQKEIMGFLEQRELADIKGNLLFLMDIAKSYKTNWDSDTFINGNYQKILDIRQDSEQQILFYANQGVEKLQKKFSLTDDKKIISHITKIENDLTNYRIALYINAFSYYLETLFLNNHKPEYLNSIISKLNDYSIKYREIYSAAYGIIEKYTTSSVQSKLLSGASKASKLTGKLVEKIPVINKTKLDESLISASSAINNFELNKEKEKLQAFSQNRQSDIGYFIDSIKQIDNLYNHPLEIVIKENVIYLDSSVS